MTSASAIPTSPAWLSSAGRTNWLPRVAIALYAISLLKVAGRDPLSGNAGVQGVLEVLLPLASVVLLAAYCLTQRTTTYVPASAKWFAGFGVISIFSASASFWPLLSLSKSCILLFAIALAILARDALGAREALRGLYYSVIAVLVAGLLVTAASANYTLLFEDEYSGRRRIAVLAIHPSMVADIAALAFLTGRICKPKPHWSIQAGLILLNVSTGTKTSTGVLIVIAILAALLSLPRRGKARAAFVPAALAATVAAVMLGNVTRFSVGDRVLDVTEPVYGTHMAEEAVSLNGRTELWQAVEQIVLRRLGTGYGFDGGREELLARVPWAGQSHNGFVELLLTGGVLGLLFALAACASSMAACFRTRPDVRWRLLSIHLYLFGVTLFGPTPVNLQFVGLVLLIWSQAFAVESMSGAYEGEEQ